VRVCSTGINRSPWLIRDQGSEHFPLASPRKLLIRFTKRLGVWRDSQLNRFLGENGMAQPVSCIHTFILKVCYCC